MKVITETALRDELRASQPEYYCIPEGTIVSPAAREYLQQRKINIVTEPPMPAQAPEDKKGTAPEAAEPCSHTASDPWMPKYVDYETGAFYMEKPEHMCQLSGNLLVPKCHPRILFRGKLDSIQTTLILHQALLADSGTSGKLIEDLNSVLLTMQNIMKCDVLDQELESGLIIGFTHGELHDRSHNPMKFFGIKQMQMPNYTMGTAYAMLNQLRAAIREVEVAATAAFYRDGKCSRKDIVEELNRLSSALHVMMCKWLAGEYR
ncbi:ATP-binding protein [Clostridium aminobutyricum]|uniref:ATP-binding protein n=1 Tax=Clostridium aminobutyricum TaxID=33953 RepID=A0A939DAM6_CLOAM|nr:ATP-binding protein [Clostridium aminobutyricum]MBN7773813.1 ATP-binding protein [Clostridium aminobutyricum]